MRWHGGKCSEDDRVITSTQHLTMSYWGGVTFTVHRNMLRKGFAMQIKRILQLVVAVAAANVFTIGLANAEVEQVVVVGKKCGDTTCGTGPFSDQKLDYDPFAAPNGGGVDAESGKVKGVMDEVVIACRPAGKSASTHTADNYNSCLVAAGDKYAARYGEVAAGYAFNALPAACTDRLNAAPAC